IAVEPSATMRTVLRSVASACPCSTQRWWWRRGQRPWPSSSRQGRGRYVGPDRGRGPFHLPDRCEPARSPPGKTLTLPVARRNRRLLASSRVPGGIAMADITRRRTAELLRVSIALLALVAWPAAAAEQSAEPKEPTPGFSFAVYGDSRSMMYLPGKSDQK